MSAIKTKTAVIPDDRQRAALITLLGDEDPAVFQTVRAKLISFGPVAAEWLRPHLLNNDPVLRRRAHAIVDWFARQNSDTQFLGFCLKQGEEFDVEEGIWMLCKTQYPEINISAYSALVDSYAGELQEQINRNDKSEHIVAVMNEFLFSKLNFVGNEDDYYNPQNSYLNRVLDRRTGNPISLCLVYILLAKRLRLPISGIGLPGHFICRFQSTTSELYIDAFNGGKLLSKADCIKYLIHTNHSLQDGHLAPVSARRILLRICANLHQIYTQHEQENETSRLQRYLVALAK